MFFEEEFIKEGLLFLVKNFLLIRSWMVMILSSSWRNFWLMKA